MSRARDQLTVLELACIANYKGNQVEAAAAAGVKNPKKNASAIFNRPLVKAALQQKVEAVVKESGKVLGRKITITRNDIINRLDKLSQDAENDSVKVSALTQLKEIFGLKPSDGKGDLFAGWTDEELEHYRRTQEFPARLTGVSAAVESPHLGGRAENGDYENSAKPELPPGRRPSVGSVQGNRGTAAAPARKRNPAKRK
jgi:hypothetical protein